ncbi:Hint domain-containing protein [Tropicimonas marinistellae]|uniref:Hint domain-containing protein n=1 Tax=Tropicimonas marinistellae TaxID=1739787 RepID=UPI000835A293|nr:Hint domain-containing protein [Tropicimonas marinistellae]
MIFDTARPTGGDRDLHTHNLHKVLILSEDGDTRDPDDNAHGGTLVFDFDRAAAVESLRVLDTEEGGSVACFDAEGTLIKKVALPHTADNGQADVEIDAEGVYRMEVTLAGSAAVDNLCFAIDPECEDGLNGIVEGDETDNLIDLGYDGDPQGDRIDNGDAILPGQGPDDDIVFAGGGDDTVFGEQGDDRIYGDRAFGEPGPVEITITDSDAHFENKLFAYTIDPESGDVSHLVILSENAKDDVGKTFSYDVNSACGVFGIGIVSPEGVFLSSGYGENLDLNTDGKLHTVGLGEEEDGSVTIGFEDLRCLGDRDFNDVIVNVNLGTSGAEFDNAHYDYVSDGPGIDDSGTGDDILDGGAGDDVLFGQKGDDTLIGGAGSDKAFGGVGNDTFIGDAGQPGAGADLMVGGDDKDTFTGVDIGDVIRGGAGGVDQDTLDLRGSGPIRLVNIRPDSDGNGFDGTVEFLDAPGGHVSGRAHFTNIETIIPCFTPGTRIATPTGEKLVEQLTAGDKVLTRDNGVQQIRWYGQKRIDYAKLGGLPHLQPVLIQAGALGGGLPEQDMLVSPNHRMLVTNDRASLYFDDHEVLIAAKHLVDNRGIRSLRTSITTYIHFMFDQHEVVLANGAWSESFQPGSHSMRGLGNAQRDEILALFPDLATEKGQGGYAAARKTLKRHEAVLLCH